MHRVLMEFEFDTKVMSQKVKQYFSYSVDKVS